MVKSGVHANLRELSLLTDLGRKLELEASVLTPAKQLLSKIRHERAAAAFMKEPGTDSKCSKTQTPGGNSGKFREIVAGKIIRKLSQGEKKERFSSGESDRMDRTNA